VQRPGPFHRGRQRALARGEEVFERYPAAAVLLTPSWIAGINRTRTAVFLFWNAVGAALWSLGIGLGAYFIGPTVVDLVGDLGLVTALGAAGLVLAGVALEFGRRRRRSRAAAATDG
jgi:membrane protein DedA with SNARE-associated domain